MSDSTNDKVKGADRGIHEVDGIIEEDNRLPQWWLGTLFGTIVFAFLYAGYYLIGDGPTLTQEYEREQVALQLAASAGGSASGAGALQGELDRALASAERKKKGLELFIARCSSCHGKLGEGGIGPNLTDSYWIHGGKPAEIAKTITEGVLDKGMPPWGSSIAPADVASITAHIVGLRGSTPPGAKAPQGTEVKL